MNNQSLGAGRLFNVRALLIASVVAMGAFLSLGVIAFTNPLHRSVAVKTTYTQQVTFGYHASAPAGPVYGPPSPLSPRFAPVRSPSRRAPRYSGPPRAG